MTARLYIGLMSGTSLDGIDGVLVTLQEDSNGTESLQLLASASIPLENDFKQQAMALQTPGDNEIHREAVLANQVALHYAACVQTLLDRAAIGAEKVCAIGAHGQTIRHCPDQGYTRQTNNPALLAERTGIDVIADFRSRDIAAGGQGAPLVPAFHHAMFACAAEERVIANIGGIGNITLLRGHALSKVTGFDTGPGNLLMDAWIGRHRGVPYDHCGAWAETGTVIEPLLASLRNEKYFQKLPPKSTGRDLFGMAWLDSKLASFNSYPPVDVQATLLALTATTIADAIATQAPEALAVYVCGGGVHNDCLLRKIEHALRALGHPALVTSTAALGISPMHVEAMAFAWLGARFKHGQAANLPLVTGAQGPRILGACYPH